MSEKLTRGGMNNAEWGKTGKNGTFKSVSNFVFDIIHSVESPHGEDGYIVHLTRSYDGISGRATFRTKDTRDSHTLASALSSSFEFNGRAKSVLFINLRKNDFFTLLNEQFRSFIDNHPNAAKCLVTRVGLQDDQTTTVLNPDMAVNRQGNKIHDSKYVWLPTWPECPPVAAARHFNEPYGFQPLRTFAVKASELMSVNYVPSMLSLSSMIYLSKYSEIMNTVSHVNIPLIFGEPMSGKTLAAQCAGLFSGLPVDQLLMSRCSLSALTSCFSESTFPIIWDDPSDPRDVGQILVDLANGAIRSKKDQRVKPTTGCLVTANFDLKEIEKYHSRLFVIKFSPLDREKEPGDETSLKHAAAKSSASFIPLLSAVNVNMEGLRCETRQLKVLFPTLDLRVLEGMAVPILILKQIYELIRLPIEEQLGEYLKNIMVPYYTREEINADVFEPLLALKPGNHNNYMNMSRDGSFIFVHAPGFNAAHGRTLHNLLATEAVKKVTHRFDRPRQASMIPTSMLPIHVRQHMIHVLRPSLPSSSTAEQAEDILPTETQDQPSFTSDSSLLSSTPPSSPSSEVTTPPQSSSSPSSDLTTPPQSSSSSSSPSSVTTTPPESPDTPSVTTTPPLSPDSPSSVATTPSQSSSASSITTSPPLSPDTPSSVATTPPQSPYSDSSMPTTSPESSPSFKDPMPTTSQTTHLVTLPSPTPCSKRALNFKSSVPVSRCGRPLKKKKMMNL